MIFIRKQKKKLLLIVLVLIIAMSFYGFISTLLKCNREISILSTKLNTYQDALSSNIVNSFKVAETHYVITSHGDVMQLLRISDDGLVEIIQTSVTIQAYHDDVYNWIVVETNDDVIIYDVSQNETIEKFMHQKFENPDMVDLEFLGSSNVDGNILYFYAVNGYSPSYLFSFNLRDQTSKIHHLKGSVGPGVQYQFSDEYDVLLYSTIQSFADIDAYDEFVKSGEKVELYSFSEKTGHVLLDDNIAHESNLLLEKNFVYYQGINGQKFIRFTK